MLEEVHEGLLEAREIVAVGFHVIGIDVGHHRDHRIEQQEGGVRLVRLGDQEVALPSRALAPAALSLPPITKVGSMPPSARMLATSEVVVVLPWVPAMAIPCLSASARRASAHAGRLAHDAPGRRSLPGCRSSPRSMSPPHPHPRYSQCRALDDRRPQRLEPAGGDIVAGSEPLT